MRVLMFHNRYRTQGGEDLSTLQETRALEQQGVEVIPVEADNELPADAGFLDEAKMGWRAAWSRASYERAARLCRDYRPDVAHVQNFWMRLSPAVHAACRRAGVATVQSLRNYRLLCTNALLLRQGKVCEDCLGKIPWRGVVRACYRESRPASAAVAGMIVFNRMRRTWERDVDAYLTLSDHSRQRFLRAGFPPQRVFIKPNCLADLGEAAQLPSTSREILYLGRLSSEKGLHVLLEASKRVGLDDVGRLTLVGEGDERESLQNLAAALDLSEPGLVFAGRKDPAEVQQMVRRARAVVLPSLAYETFGRPIIEAFAAGRPAIVSDFGAPSEIVDRGRTGLTFPRGDVDRLGEALRTVLSDGAMADNMGRRARAEYEAKYTLERSFETLMKTYRFALERRGRAIPEKLRDFEAIQAPA